MLLFGVVQCLGTVARHACLALLGGLVHPMRLGFCSTAAAVRVSAAQCRDPLALRQGPGDRRHEGRTSHVSALLNTCLMPHTPLFVRPTPFRSLNLKTEAKGIAGDAEIARIIDALPQCPVAGKDCKK